MNNNKSINRKKSKSKRRQRPSKRSPEAIVLQKDMKQTYAFLSKCGREYIQTLVNPFHGPLGCVPSYYPIMTYKQRCFVKGTVVVGTNGYGSICCDPYNAIVNDKGCVAVTDATYAGTAIGDVGLVGCSEFNSNSLFASTDFSLASNKDQGRIVGAGLRIRYNGTELNRNGTVYALSDPTHSTVLGLNSAGIAAEVESRKLPVTKTWTTLLYKPFEASDFELTVKSFPLSSAPGNDRWYMGFLINSSVNAVTFDYEFFAVHEIQGRNVRGMTKSHSDPTGLSAAVTAIQDHRPNQVSREHEERSLIDSAKSVISYGVSHMKEIGSTASNIYEGYNYLKGGYNTVKGLMSGDTSSVLNMMKGGIHEAAEFAPALLEFA